MSNKLLHGDIVARVSVTYYAGNQISIDGSIGDKQFAIKLLEHALDTLRRKSAPDQPLLVHPCDVDLVMAAAYPKTPWGDRK